MSADIESGPCPGLLGDIAALHGRYYAAHWDFPVSFEAKVAREMGDFLVRYDPGQDVVLRVGDGTAVRGAVTLDGSDPALAPGQVHLRWFIVAPELAGQGWGGRLMDAALAFARKQKVAMIYLTTFDGLGPAMSLYRRAGFRLTSEAEGRTWGKRVLEQRLELQLS